MTNWTCELVVIEALDRCLFEYPVIFDGRAYSAISSQRRELNIEYKRAFMSTATDRINEY